MDLADSLEAIRACYHGLHWQRAVELLVIPLYPHLDAADRELLVSGREPPVDLSASSAPPGPPPSSASGVPVSVDGDEAYIELS